MIDQVKFQRASRISSGVEDRDRRNEHSKTLVADSRGRGWSGKNGGRRKGSA